MALADIPGLIQGAHKGLGLGTRFLKHVSRSGVLLHILSIEEVDLDDPWIGFELVNQELKAFEPDLLLKNQIQAINKIDLWSSDAVHQLKDRARAEGKEMFFVSALHGTGLQDVLQALWRKVSKSAYL